MANPLLDEFIAGHVQNGHCPDCGYRGFVLGPRGGAGQNIECGNVDCAARFNVVPFGGRILYAERIPKRTEGGMSWLNDDPPFVGSFS